MLGAAGATLGTELVRTVWTQVYAGRAGFPFPSLSRFWRPAAAATAMAGALLAARPTAVWLAVPLGAAVYGGVLTLLGGIRLRQGSAPELNL
jgi:hypothetical protein